MNKCVSHDEVWGKLVMVKSHKHENSRGHSSHHSAHKGGAHHSSSGVHAHHETHSTHKHSAKHKSTSSTNGLLWQGLAIAFAVY